MRLRRRSVATEVALVFFGMGAVPDSSALRFRIVPQRFRENDTKMIDGVSCVMLEPVSTTAAIRRRT
jgi:hypothetical protein